MLSKVPMASSTMFVFDIRALFRSRLQTHIIDREYKINHYRIVE